MTYSLEDAIEELETERARLEKEEDTLLAIDYPTIGQWDDRDAIRTRLDEIDQELDLLTDRRPHRPGLDAMLALRRGQ